MDVEQLVKDIKRVREKGVGRVKPDHVPALMWAAARCWPELDEPARAHRIEEFLEDWTSALDAHHAEGIRLALGCGGLGGSSADRRSAFAGHYDRTSETVRRAGGLEDQAFARLARVILDHALNASPVLATTDERIANLSGGPRPAGARSSLAARDEPRPLRGRSQVRVGRAPLVGVDYQRRSFDEAIEQAWADGGDRRIWLRGQPGMGKSYTARRVMQEALSSRGEQREDLLIWVDSANAEGVRTALSHAVDMMPNLRIAVDLDDPDRVEKQATALLQSLDTSRWRWLIVLDNADAASILDAGLVPSGQNPNGRTLITTLSQDHRLSRNGRIVKSGLFRPAESAGYLRGQVDPSTGRAAAIAGATDHEMSALASTVGHHPLALSIAVATITANQMEINDWIDEFESSAAMDDAADERDGGGYPHLISATWRVALEKASAGLAPGLVQRAAAVAALQDPDGHPTWIWSRASVVAWISRDDDFPVKHARPVVVERLLANGLIDISGTWKAGTVAIHQLAARAVRELLPGHVLTELAELLAVEWLKRVADEGLNAPVGLAGTIDPLAAAGAPSEVTTLVLAALRRLSRDFDRSESRDARLWEKRLTRAQAEYDLYANSAGYFGLGNKASLASQAYNLGILLEIADREEDAHARFVQSVELYREVVGDAELAPAQLAAYLDHLADSLASIGHQDDSKAIRERAVQIYRDLLSAEVTDDEAFDYLKKLASNYEKLDAPDEMLRAVRHNYALLRRVVNGELEFTTEAVEGRLEVVLHTMRLDAIADWQRQLGELKDAAATLTRNAEIRRTQIDASAASRVEIALAALYLESGDRDEAELCLNRALEGRDDADDEAQAGDLVRLASVQAGSGRMSDAIATIARAVARFRSADQRAVEPEQDRHEWELTRSQTMELIASREFGEENWSNAAWAYRRVVEEIQDQAEGSPGEYHAEHELATAFHNLAAALLNADDPARAVEASKMAVANFQTLFELSGGDIELRRQLAAACGSLARASLRVGDRIASVAALRRQIDNLRGILDAERGDARALLAATAALRFLGAMLSEDAMVDEARTTREAAVATARELLALDPDSVEAQEAMVNALAELASSVAEHTGVDAAEPIWVEEAHARRVLRARDSSPKWLALDLGRMLVWQGHLYAQAGQLGEAVHRYEASVRSFDEVEGIEANRLAGIVHLQLAAVGERLSDTEMQQIHGSAAVEKLRSCVAADPGDVESLLVFVAALLNFGEFLLGAGQDSDAANQLGQALNTVDTLVAIARLPLPRTPNDLQKLLTDAMGQLCEVLPRVGRADEADRLRARAREIYDAFPNDDGVEG